MQVSRTLLNYFKLIKEYDNAENKIAFLDLQTKDDYDLLAKRHFNSREKQTLFSNLGQDNRRKNLNDTEIRTIN